MAIKTFLNPQDDIRFNLLKIWCYQLLHFRRKAYSIEPADDQEEMQFLFEFLDEHKAEILLKLAYTKAEVPKENKILLNL